MIYCFFLLFSFSVWSLEAVVKISQTPLFISESEKSKIAEFRIKGEILSLNESYNFHLTNESNIPFSQTKFYKTLDRLGMERYVRAKDLEVYYNDTRELDADRNQE